MVVTRPGQYIPWYHRLELTAILPSLVLALLMMYGVSRSIAVSGWAPGIEILPALALPALLVGLLTARVRQLPRWLAHSLSMILGVVLTIALIGPTLVSEISTEFGEATAARLDSWSDYGSEMLIRVLVWARILAAGGRGEDILLYLLSLALLMWLIGYVTGRLLFYRERAWMAVVLNALPLLVNYTFAWPKPTFYFFIFLGAALLLIAQQQIVQQQRRWVAAAVEFPEYLGLRFVAAAALFLGGLVLVTSLLPSNISSQQVARAWQIMSSPLTAVREGWQNAFATIQAPPGTSGGGFTTRNVRVGGGRILSNDVVMNVRSDEYDYWRAVAFERYTGNGWQSNVGERARQSLGALTAEDARSSLNVGQVLPLADIRGRRLVTQTIEVVQQRADRLLMFGGQFVAAGIPVLVQHGFTTNQDGLLLPNGSETASIVSQAPVLETQIYTVTSLISIADEQSLRAAGTNYPAWINQEYLQLPESVTERTRDYARDVVTRAGATNPYDQALAIENDLRRLIYDETRPSPVERGDWVDYFLFETRRGYCDDFASAFVVMTRSLGIPSRWVQGYAGGTLDPTTGSYIVRESVAHSWPEVYFPGFGWQRFEPTPASYATPPLRPSAPDDELNPVAGESSVDQDLLDRLREANENQEGMTDAEIERLRREIEARQQAEALRQAGLWAAALAVVGLIGFSIWTFFRQQVKGLAPVATIYLRLSQLAAWAGVPLREHVTPQEYAGEVAAVVPGQRRNLERIAQAYTAERYGNTRVRQIADLEDDWRSIRGELLRTLPNRWFGRNGRDPRNS